MLHYGDESVLHYNYYRPLDPSTGRYLESDPIGLFGGPNTYSYALGNPISLYDPYGLWVPPPLPDSVANFGTGVADALSFGLGRRAREAMGFGWKADPCSDAYVWGECASFLGGVGRSAYAGLAKGLSHLVRGGGDELAYALRVSAGRNFLKRTSRDPLFFLNYKIYLPAQILNKYGADPATIIRKSTTTSKAWNAVGDDTAAGSVTNRAANGCGCER